MFQKGLQRLPTSLLLMREPPQFLRVLLFHYLLCTMILLLCLQCQWLATSKNGLLINRLRDGEAWLSSYAAGGKRVATARPRSKAKPHTAEAGQKNNSKKAQFSLNLTFKSKR